MHFMALKNLRTLSGVVIYSYCESSAFIAVKRDAKF